MDSWYAYNLICFRTSLKGTVILTPLLGTTWLFGLFAFNDSTIVFQYLFVIFNSLQGVFMFVIYCLLNEEVQSVTVVAVVVVLFPFQYMKKVLVPQSLVF